MAKKIIPLEKKAPRTPIMMPPMSEWDKKSIKTPIISTVIQYAFLILLALTCVWLYRIGFFHRFTILPAMSGPAILFFALSFSFMWVEVWKFGVTKPFNCLKCMTGWVALIFALAFHVEHWYLYLFAGVFLGAVFDSAKNRWL